ncbi:ABC transporter ATP-binding protein [Cognatilysobacter tabacisoli]|uniref:ABC transporter ATP-binding protein n=1 Tax=Cognatilysobacter tabacisoli TaxID=2315424 RepID=UPI000E6B4593|nr:ABC transporter ATP-binding protein [Lysobacter tabacisoli]
MSSERAAIRIENVGKCYPLYERPADRLKQFILPRFSRLARREPARYFEEYWALRDVSFEVARGEQVGIVGRNGAGKSTLLQIICNTLAPTTGTVNVEGRVAALLELGAGFNPQQTGEENVFLNGCVLGLSRQQVEERYDRILAFADVGDFIAQPVKNYSSGMYMRLAFAIAVHVEPDVLVVDEALSVGDEAFQRKCHARIKKIRDDGATILFVSHSAGHVTEVCSRAILLDGGELLSVGPAKHVISRYQKLLYAPASRAQAIRDELRHEHLQGGSIGPLHEEAPSAGAGLARPDSADTPQSADGVDTAYFDPGLVPRSTVVYPSLGCAIEDPHLQSLEGRRVNVLQAGREYVYAYRAHFDAAAVAVRFGMMIKTVTGVELGGAASAPEVAPHAYFAGGQSVAVRFRFRAMLAPGTYFLNAGVVGLLGEQEQYLCRYVDIAMFRVGPVSDGMATGMVDFGITPEIRVADDDSSS